MTQQELHEPDTQHVQHEPVKMWLFLAAAIVLEVTGSLALKAALDNPFFYAVVVAGFIGSFACLFKSLRNGMNLGVGYGIWGACGVALTAAMSRVIFGEPITLLMGIGMAVIIAGVLLIEFGSHVAQKSAHKDLVVTR